MQVTTVIMYTAFENKQFLKKFQKYRGEIGVSCRIIIGSFQYLHFKDLREVSAFLKPNVFFTRTSNNVNFNRAVVTRSHFHKQMSAIVFTQV